jgi:hypothetical protein
MDWLWRRQIDASLILRTESRDILDNEYPDPVWNWNPEHRKRHGYSNWEIYGTR